MIQTSSLIAKVNTTLLETEVVTHQNAVRTNRWNEELSFLQERSGRVEKVEEGYSRCVNIKQPKTSLRFALPSFWLLISKGTSQFLVQFVLAIGFLQDSFILYSQKHDSQDATELPPLIPTRYTRFKIRNTAYRSGLYTSSKYHFVPSKQEEYMGAFHSTKNSGMTFRNVLMSNGTVFSTTPDRSR